MAKEPKSQRKKVQPKKKDDASNRPREDNRSGRDAEQRSPWDSEETQRDREEDHPGSEYMDRDDDR